MLPDNAGIILLPIARAAIADALGQGAAQQIRAPWLEEPAASFVTLTQDGILRGCVGTLVPRRSLVSDVQANAVAAALHDSRFVALTVAELGTVHIEVSVLSPIEALQCDSQSHALTQLRPHIDGVIFEHGLHRSTFLPQVWTQLPEPLAFLTHLKRKAGVAGSLWDSNVKLWRYTVLKWSEAAPQTPLTQTSLTK